ncbi:MAG: hydroxymethylbilane synthase [Acidimicrobiales bacterium]
MILRIATRRSPLAVWQAEHVAGLITAAHPGIGTELVTTDTSADRDLTRQISEIGGKGAFSKEIQDLVMVGRADLAVHSAKDLQADTPEALRLVAVPARADAADALVGATLDDLPEGAVVGTGSARRRVLLEDLRPDLKIVGLRGNIATRLGRLDELDALVMAGAALDRLAITGLPVERLDPAAFVPQVGQGALAVECRADDPRVVELLAPLDDPVARLTVTAERRFLQRLGGDCDLPAGAHAVPGPDGVVTVSGVLSLDDGSPLRRMSVTGAPETDPGGVLAGRLLDPAAHAVG